MNWVNERLCITLGSLLGFRDDAVRRLPSLCIIHRAGIGGKNGVRRRAVSPGPLLLFGVVCITANVGLENSILIKNNHQENE